MTAIQSSAGRRTRKVGTAAGETLVIDWTATFDTWHEVIVAPKPAALGRYTLAIEELP